MVKIPNKNENNNAVITPESKEIFPAFKNIFPIKTKGRLNKKLIFNDKSSVYFRKRRTDTVSPERDNPGKAENPWANPTKKASVFLKDLLLLILVFLDSFLHLIYYII